MEDYPSKNMDEEEEVPVLVFYSGNAEVDSATGDDLYPGYHQLEDGRLQFFTWVDEDYANNHEVWIYSINESVDAYGRWLMPCDMDGGCGGGPTGGPGPGGDPIELDPDADPTDAPYARNNFPDLGHNKVNFKIEGMRVADYKENWKSGSSEIAIRAKLTCHNGRHEGMVAGAQEQYSSDQYSTRLGKLIKKFKRKWVKNVEYIAVNYSLQKDWQNEEPYQDPVYFHYVIFERDHWPTAYQDNDPSCPTSLLTGQASPGTFPLQFRSNINYGGAYKIGLFGNNPNIISTGNDLASSGLVQNSEIAFNTVFY